MSDTAKPKIYTVGKRTIQEIIADLSKPLPARHLKTKTLKNTQITFIEWHTAVKLLDFYAPGWCYEVRNIYQVGTQLVCVARITINASDGFFHREATGIEEEDKGGYGDAASNAEAMALKRAAAKFGLGLYLYKKGAN